MPTAEPPAIDAAILRAWIDYCFDRSHADWWREPHDRAAPPYFLDEGHPRASLAYLSSLCRSGPDIARRFRRDQVAWGIWYLFSGITGSPIWALHDSGLTTADRVQFLASLTLLYRDCFDPLTRRWQGFDASDDADSDPLAIAVYMIWDIGDVEHAADHPHDPVTRQAAFQTLEDVLAMRSRACQISALHGLGHLIFRQRAHAQPIIDRFLTRLDIAENVRAYAQAARTGSVM